MNAVYADAGWIEINMPNRELKVTSRHIGRENINRKSKLSAPRAARLLRTLFLQSQIQTEFWSI